MAQYILNSLLDARHAIEPTETIVLGASFQFGTKLSFSGENTRRDEIAEWHNYAEYDIMRSDVKK